MWPGTGPHPVTGMRATMTSDFDVVVVGARVAGAPTAMLLARQGHRVLLLDRASMPSDVVSTHAITRSGVLQLRRWGLERRVAAITAPVRRVVLGFGDERIGFDVRPEHGVRSFYAPRRQRLDALLVDAAQESGVVFLPGTRVTELMRRGETVCGVVTDDAVFPSRMVIGADGVWSRVARLVTAQRYVSHEPTNAVNYAYFTGVEAPGFWFQFTPGVNAGLICTADDQVCVFVGRPNQDFGRFYADPDAEFGRLLSMAGADLHGRVKAGRRVSAFRGTPGLPGFLRKPWGDGWALVGDAGYTKDPISAHGISDAFRDAELCARAVDAALEAPGDAAEHLTRYQTVRDQLSIRVLEESAGLARYSWSAEDASRRMRHISAAVRDESEALAALPAWAQIPALAPA